MKVWKGIALVGLLGLVLTFGRWYSDGAMIFTKTAEQSVVRDELFGTESVEWKEGFWLGLDIAGPVSAVWIGFLGFGIYRVRRNS